MEDDLYSIRLPEVRKDLYRAIIECDKRCLINSAKWLAELNYGLKDVKMPDNYNLNENIESGINIKEYDDYYLAKSYFHRKEYDRAAYFTRNCESSVPKFLHLYSSYMAKEKKRLDNTTDTSNLNDSGHVQNLSDLLAVLKAEYNQGNLDGYCLYLYGVVLKKLDLVQAAINVFIESIHATPLLWSSWVELVPLISDKDKLISLNLPKHWMKHIFMGHAYVELYLNDEGIKQYEELQLVGFRKCLFLTSEMAIAYHNKRDVDKAIDMFQTLQEVDPYRLDNVDILSNLLFVKELKTEMASLAHRAVEIDKYRPETCCVVGNYYSIRCDHQKAIVYFQRALKLNPQYLSAWTLMGHEFMELKNTNAAIQCYRKAVEVNKRDYRAWYGLGQSYEILKLHFYSLYYFKIAHQLRPYDSRMLVALGETYEKLDKTDNAIKCFQKACNVGDIEGIALFRLGKLYEKQNNMDKAVSSYLQYCLDERSTVEKSNLYHAYMTLANYYEDKGNHEEASHFAYKCLESEEKKSEAKALLKTIENKRPSIIAAHQPPPPSSAPQNVNEDVCVNEVWMEESDMVIENVDADNGSSNMSASQTESNERRQSSVDIVGGTTDVDIQNTEAEQIDSSINSSSISID